MTFEENIKRLRAAKGDPEKLVLATADIVLAGRQPELRTMLEVAAVPHWFDIRILSLLLEIHETTAAEQIKEFVTLPMVESFPLHRGWNVHEATRLALRKELRDKSAARFYYLSGLAAKCFEGEDTASRIENIYHRLLAFPERAAGELERLWKDWDNAGRYEWLQALGVALDELIRTDHLAPVARAQALVCFGSIRSGRLTLRKSEAYAREALSLFHELSHESGEADAHDQLGDILKSAGKLPGALAEYGLSRQIAKSFAEREPENTKSQRELSVSHQKVGSVLEAQGSLSEALLEYQAYQDIMRQLAKREPENTGWQRVLSISHSNVGSVLEAQGQYAEALKEYRAGKEITRQLIDSDQENADWQRDLSVSHMLVGSVLETQRQYAEALEEYRSAKKIMTKLTRRDPGNTEWQKTLSVTYNRMGLVLQAQGDLDGAQKEYEAYRQIMMELTELDPENTLWQRELAVAHQCVGVIFDGRDRLEESLVEFEAANLIAERLVRHDPTNNNWKRDLQASRRFVENARLKLSAAGVIKSSEAATDD